MEREPLAYLWDVQYACRNVLDFVREVEFDRYLGDVMLRSAVERQLQNMGEALSQLARIDSDLAAQVPEHRSVIAFRNVLVHGYATLDHQVVWHVIGHDLPALLATASALLKRTSEAPPE
jgi:uncharacterized protein with HEPN domain